MNAEFNKLIQRFKKMDLFKRCFTGSFILHVVIIFIYYFPAIIAFASSKEIMYDGSEITNKNVEVDFIDLPESIVLGGNTNPAPVQKEEWIEGSGEGKTDAENTDVNINKLSGTGTDADGYMFADLADHAPIPIIDFNPDDYFPKAARSANITRNTVIVEVQVNENGSINSSKVISDSSSYGFDDAAMKVVARMRFRPGKVNGEPVKMLVRLPIVFTLEN
ncbi:MAG: TonB family protein [Spirochaetes bacterium]|nr:TonB family protein [Spirochaetota bacterium]